MQRSKVKKCLLVLLLSLSMAFTMVPGGVLAEGNDNDNSEGVNVEENEGGDAVKQEAPKAEGEVAADASGVSDEAAKDEEKKADADAGNAVGNKAVLKSAKAQTAAFLDTNSGDDANDGTDKTKAVRTFAKAYELAGEGGTIVICGESCAIEISNSKMTVKNVTIVRDASYDNSGRPMGMRHLFEIDGSYNITFENVTVDGNKDNAAVAEASPLLWVHDGGQLTFKGTTLKNNGFCALDVEHGAKFTMESGTITGNTNANEGGGGIFAHDGATVNLNGGTIENNSAYYGAGICIINAQVYLNGTDVENNTSIRNGAGVYIGNDGYGSYSSYDLTTRLAMTSGAIKGNAAGGNGGAILAWDARSDDAAAAPYDKLGVCIEIKGGELSDNTAGDGDGEAIALRGDWWGNDIVFPELRLSGSPTISGEVYLQDIDDAGENMHKGAVIDVTGAFAPTQPVLVADNNYVIGRDVIRYAAGVSPDLNAFKSAAASYPSPIGLIQDKANPQNLEWVDMLRVNFTDGKSDTIVYSTWVLPGSAIDPAEVPGLSRTGYTHSGWLKYGTDTEWNMADDKVEEALTLAAKWTLNTPEVTIKADKTEAKAGETITLTAVVSHDLKGVSCKYEWYKDGKVIKDQENSLLKVTEGGNYSVKVTITDENGLSASGTSEEVKCTFKAAGASGTGNTNGTGNANGISGTVKTGDESHAVAYLLVLLAALGAGIMAVSRKRAR